MGSSRSKHTTVSWVMPEDAARAEEIIGEVRAKKIPIARHPRSNDALQATLLMLASQNNLIHHVRWLVAAGAPLDAISTEGATALMYAVGARAVPVVECLVEAGANVNRADARGGNTALLRACWDGNLSLVDYLLQHEANLHAKNVDGISAVLCVAQYDTSASTPLLRYLVEVGADVNDADYDRETVLQKACRTKDAGTIKHLLKLGANPHSTDSNGFDASYVAACLHLPTTVRVLLAAGAEIIHER